VITKNWETFDAKVLALDPLNDLAVIKINPSSEVTPLKFISEYEGKNSEIKIWQFSIAIWNALAEFQNSVSLGVISGTNRTIEAENERLTWLLQTDTAINPGNSGGPLVNLDGKVMWINTAIAGRWSQGIGFSIPLSTKKINYILESVKNYWEIKKPFLGIKYTILSHQNNQNFDTQSNYWAYILPWKDSILQWSSAEKSWLRAEDIILSVDGQKVTMSNDLLSIIQNKIPWDILQLEVQEKSWKIKNLSLTLGIEK
jgi:S1-C subfamily serine protease